MRKKIQIRTSALVIDGKKYECKIHLTPRKTSAITVHPDLSVTVRAPLSAKVTEIEDWVSSKLPWIEKHLVQFKERIRSHKKYSYADGEKQLLLGNLLTLKVNKSKKQRAEILENYILIYARDESRETVRTILKKFLSGIALKEFQKRLSGCHARTLKYRLPFPDLRIRWMKSRWGSCSRRRGITLNAHLIRMPQEIIDYVIFHELTHLRIPNHGPQFYKILADLVPDWKKKDKILRSYGEHFLWYS